MNSEPIQKDSGTLFLLQVIRAVAASGVVFHHVCREVAAHHHAPALINRLGRLQDIGAAGVDVFFAISGFIIVHTSAKLHGPEGALTFARHRVIRVAPLYWFWTTALLWLCVFAGALHGVTLTPWFVGRSYLFLSTATDHPLLAQGWTLSFEMYFYALVFAVILMGTQPRLMALSGLLFAGFWLGSINVLPRDLFGSPMVFEFLGGALAAVMLPTLKRLVTSRAGLVLIAAGIGIIGLSAALPDPLSLRWEIWGPAGVLIVAGSAVSSWKPAGPIGRFSVFLGAASYTIYLTHAFATLTLGTMLKKGLGQNVPPDLIIVAGAPVTVLVCSALYPLIEQPMLRWARSVRLPGRRAIADGQRDDRAAA